MRREAATMVELLKSPATHLYLCGLKDMEHGVEASLPTSVAARRHELGEPPQGDARPGPLSRRDLLRSDPAPPAPEDTDAAGAGSVLPSTAA